MNSNKPLAVVMGLNTSLSLQKRVLRYGPDKMARNATKTPQQLLSYAENPQTRNRANNLMNQEIKNAYGTESVRRPNDSPELTSR